MFFNDENVIYTCMCKSVILDVIYSSPLKIAFSLDTIPILIKFGLHFLAINIGIALNPT